MIWEALRGLEDMRGEVRRRMKNDAKVARFAAIPQG